MSDPQASFLISKVQERSQISKPLNLKNSGNIPGPQAPLSCELGPQASLPGKSRKGPRSSGRPILKLDERSQTLKPSHHEESRYVCRSVCPSFFLSSFLSCFMLMWCSCLQLCFFLAFYMSVMSFLSCISALLRIGRWFVFLSFVTVFVYFFLESIHSDLSFCLF